MEVDNLSISKELYQNLKEQEKEYNDVCAVIFKVNNQDFCAQKNFYDIDLFGKSMLDWVKSAVFDANIICADYDAKSDMISVLKNVADKNSKYTFVLFSDTPLFTRKSFLEIFDYFKHKGLSVLKLTRGYVFETRYLFEIEKLLSPENQYFEEEDFITCYSLKQVAMVSDILKNRIISYHQKNGVLIEDASSTFIDCNVKIGKGCQIKPFCQLKGNTILENNVTLNSNTIVENSVILENCNISHSIVKNSFIESNVSIFPNCLISNNSKVESGVVVPSYCNIDGVVIKKEDKLKSFCSYIAKK